MHTKFIVDVVRKKNGWNHFVRIILEKSISQGNAEENPKKKGKQNTFSNLGPKQTNMKNYDPIKSFKT